MLKKFTFVAFVVLALAAFSACDDGGGGWTTGPDLTIGTEGKAFMNDGTRNSGLTCSTSNVCIKTIEWDAYELPALECAVDADCDSGKLCNNGKCEEVVADNGGGAGGATSGCKSTSECGVGKFCDETGACKAKTLSPQVVQSLLINMPLINKLGKKAKSPDSDNRFQGSSGGSQDDEKECISDADCQIGKVCKSDICIDDVNVEITDYECAIDGITGVIDENGKCSCSSDIIELSFPKIGSIFSPGSDKITVLINGFEHIITVNEAGLKPWVMIKFDKTPIKLFKNVVQIIPDLGNAEIELISVDSPSSTTPYYIKMKLYVDCVHDSYAINSCPNGNPLPLTFNINCSNIDNESKGHCRQFIFNQACRVYQAYKTITGVAYEKMCGELSYNIYTEGNWPNDNDAGGISYNDECKIDYKDKYSVNVYLDSSIGPYDVHEILHQFHRAFKLPYIHSLFESITEAKKNIGADYQSSIQNMKEESEDLSKKKGDCKLAQTYVAIILYLNNSDSIYNIYSQLNSTEDYSKDSATEVLNQIFYQTSGQDKNIEELLSDACY